MAVSGLGLILILLFKLVRLERTSNEKKQAMEMLFSRMAAIEVAGDGIGFVDENHNLTYMNRALMNLHGIEQNELDQYIGRPWENLYNEQGRVDVRENVMPLLIKNKYWEGEAPVQRKDGKIIQAELSLTMLEDGGFIGTARDITSRKRNEREREELQRQFFHAQKMEAVGRLAGGIAHDFNNILASMMGYTEFLMEDLPKDSKQHYFASQIFSGSVQAQKLIDQILAFSRQNKSTPEYFDLVETVEEVRGLLIPMIPSMITMDVEINTDEAPVEGNASHINQALVNLCVNAMDAIGEEHGTIKVEVGNMSWDDFCFNDMVVDKIPGRDEAMPVVHEKGEGGSALVKLGKLVKDRPYVCVKISDTGCGMPKEVIEQAFEPFFTTKPVDQGTGLGLSSVHGIIAAHGGAVVVESTEGVGTSFTVFLPATDISGGEAIVGGEGHIFYEGTGNILLVEDEAHVSDMMTHAMERLGYTVHLCTDGDEAVDHVRENPDFYDLIVSDYSMPRMTGLEMVRELAEDFPDLPVIMLSGYSKRRLKTIMAENPTIKAVLRKPVKRDILSKNIHMALKEARQEAA